MERAFFKNFDMEKFSAGTFGMFGGKRKLLSGWNLKTVLLVWSRSFWTGCHADSPDEKHFSMQTHISVSPKFFGWLASLEQGR